MSTSSSGYPPISGNTGGPMGTTICGIGGSSQSYTWTSFSSGSRSSEITCTLDPGMEMRFALHRSSSSWSSWIGEVWLEIIQQSALDNSWDGPVIANNQITFDATNNNPNAVGLFLSNCDLQDYSITTQANTIEIGRMLL